MKMQFCILIKSEDYVKCYVHYGVLLMKHHAEVGKTKKSSKFWLLVGKDTYYVKLKEKNITSVI